MTKRGRLRALIITGALLLGGCQLIAGVDTGAVDGTGAGAGCKADSDCPSTSLCMVDTCVSGACHHVVKTSLVPDDGNPCTDDSCDGPKDQPEQHRGTKAGTPCGSQGSGFICDGKGSCQECTPGAGPLPPDKQVVGDCKTVVCDAAGKLNAVPDGADLPPDDGSGCTAPSCEGGAPGHPALPVGTTCGPGLTSFCNASAECVFCTGTFGCDATKGEYCFNEASCASCKNGVKDGDEAGVDCGGSCSKCNASACGADAECVSGHCADGYCCNSACTAVCFACDVPGKAGSCTDLPRSLQEPGTCDGTKACDKGGQCKDLCCGKQAFGATCLSGSDCMSGHCGAGYCKLQQDDPCAQDWDCETYNCVNNLCDNCNQSADCPVPSTCVVGRCTLLNGELCGVNADCASNVCAGTPPKCQ